MRATSWQLVTRQESQQRLTDLMSSGKEGPEPHESGEVPVPLSSESLIIPISSYEEVFIGPGRAQMLTDPLT